MVSASVSLLTACILGIFAISHGFPAIIQTSENQKSTMQSNSYNAESYTAIDNPVGPDYVSYDSSSGSSSSQSYEYDSNLLSIDNGPYSTAESLIQQQQQEMQQQYSSSQQQLADYTSLGGSVVSTQQQQSEYEYNQQHSSLSQVVSY